jgi:hypothetical protein
MDRVEAKWILLRRMAVLRQRPYAELVAMFGELIETEVIGRSGAKYTVEMQVFWDDKPDENVRISGAIDDGGWSAFVPLCWGDIVSRPPQR